MEETVIFEKGSSTISFCDLLNSQYIKVRNLFCKWNLKPNLSSWPTYLDDCFRSL